MKPFSPAARLLVLFLFFAPAAFAQTSLTPATPWGTWFIGTVQLPGGERKWGGFAEVQSRSNALFRQVFYYELKGGVTYSLDKNFTLALAGGRYATYDFQDLPAGPLNREWRVWEQLIINQFLARLRFEHRYRVEQRWFAFRDGSNTFRNRVRYRLNAFLPLNHTTLEPGTVFLSAFDEIFLNPIGPVFERNRLYVGVGYQFNARLTAQAGWVNQTNYNPARFEQGVFTPQLSSGKNNVMLTLTYRLNARKAAPAGENLPSQQD